MTVKLTIDHREKDLKTAFPNANYENLDLGDIKIEKDDQIFLLIERKTFCDLISSIGDGRYRNQKHRLLGSGIDKSKIIYILEGTINQIPGEMKKLFGMIINTVFRDQFNVLRFTEIEETIYFLKRIIEKLENNDPAILGLQSNDYLSTIKMKKKDNLTPENCSILQLSQIPGVSLTIARRILEEYQSIPSLLKAYEEKKETLIKDLEITLNSGKKRKIGKVVSERIYQYFFINSST